MPSEAKRAFVKNPIDRSFQSYFLCFYVSWCSGKDKKFYVGNFNDDLRADWLCHHPDGKVCVRYNSRVFGCKSLVAQQLSGEPGRPPCWPPRARQV